MYLPESAQEPDNYKLCFGKGFPWSWFYIWIHRQSVHCKAPAVVPNTLEMGVVMELLFLHVSLVLIRQCTVHAKIKQDTGVIYAWFIHSID